MNDKTVSACRALFELAFGEGSPAFGDLLFENFAPDCLRVIEEDGVLKSMLFSIPYDLQTEKGTVFARYLYAVATAPEARGQGYAGALLRREIDRGEPVFLRPSSPSLFDFYGRVGFAPLSPILEQSGVAYAAETAKAGDFFTDFRELSPREYLIERHRFLKVPFAEPSERFLRVHRSYGSAVGDGERFAALFERHGESVFFKEWLGDVSQAPAVAAALGAATYRLRTYHGGGTPFGVGANCPADTAFLIAMD